MYIQKAQITNIRAIDHFELDFHGESAGWHVLIGDNGSGKSSIIRSIALALIGKEQSFGIRIEWSDWLKRSEHSAAIRLDIITDKDLDPPRSGEVVNSAVTLGINLKTDSEVWPEQVPGPEVEWMYRTQKGWFSAGFGPFRRFTGGSKEYEKIYQSPSYNKIASHLSLFGEDVALTEATDWLMKLQYQKLEQKSSGDIIPLLKSFINSPEFLPHGSTLHEVSSEGVFFKDGNGAVISINQMSDGFRSILSLTFELIRQLIKAYGEQKVFEQISVNNMIIDVPGVVLIDEVDAHLHPSWQTRIGHWFLKYFPKIQFIVTTHSALVCRASEKGTIWRLAAPGTDTVSGEVTGIERDRLIFGNVLDAYGTEIFGSDVSKSKESNDKLSELAELNIKSIKGQITKNEEERQKELKAILPSEQFTLNDPAAE